MFTSQPWTQGRIVQPPVFLIKSINLPTAFTTFSRQLRHLSTHCVIALSLTANISSLKCPLLTGVCSVTCKLYINLHYSHCIFWNFVSFHFLCCTAFIYARLIHLLIKSSFIVYHNSCTSCHLIKQEQWKHFECGQGAKARQQRCQVSRGKEWGMGKHCKLPQWGPGHSPDRKWFWLTVKIKNKSGMIYSNEFKRLLHSHASDNLLTWT